MWLLLTVALGAAALLLSTSIYSFRSFSRSAALVHAAAEVRVELEKLLSDLVDAETGQRGYLLTGNQEFLEPYHRGVQSAKRRIQTLRERADLATSTSEIVDLAALVASWTAILATNIELMGRGDVDAAVHRVELGVGKRVMDEIRAHVAEIARGQEALLDRRRALANRRDHITLVFASGSAVAFALALAMGAILRQTDKQRRRSEAERDMVLEQMPVGVALADARTGTIRYENRTMKELLDDGDDRRDAVTRFRELLGELGAGGRCSGLDGLPLAHALHDKTVQNVELTVEGSGGAERWLLASAAPVYGHTGEVDYGVFTAKDITDKKRAEHALASANEALARLNAELERRVAARTAALQESNAELEAFSYSVSHDLRAPLRAVAGYCRVLEEDHGAALDGEGRATLQRALAAAHRMGQLIDDLLTLSRVARVEVRKQPVDLSDLSRKVIEDLRSQQPRRRIDVQIEDGLVDVCDARLIRLVLENLLGNAWKFTARCAAPRIELGASPRDGTSRVYRVRDNGAGFDMKYAGRLFVPFQRLHPPSEFEGTGIGLATVRRVIIKHGGRVWIESAVGQGTTVHFTLDSTIGGGA